MAKLKEEIVQGRPFASLAEEALLNLLRTADCVQRAMQKTTRAHGITATQYNVLRILRGAEDEGLTCSAIGDRMITADPDITRLLARLKAMGLVGQKRDKRDRRVVWTHISRAGLAVLAELDPIIAELPRQMLSELSADRLQELIALLELARARCGEPQTPATCDGRQHPLPTRG